MDINLTTVLVSIITGIVSLMTLKIQKTEGILNDKMEDQSVFMEKEKVLRQKLVEAEKKRNSIIEQMALYSMQINLILLLSIKSIDEGVVDNIQKTIEDFESSYKEISEYINRTSQEYDMLIDVLNRMQEEIRNLRKKKKFSLTKSE